MQQYNSNEYWKSITKQKILTTEKIANGGILQMKAIYAESLRYLKSELDLLYLKYSKSGVVNRELVENIFASRSDMARYIKRLEVRSNKIGADAKLLKEKFFLQKLTRLKALELQIENELLLNSLELDQVMKSRLYRVAKISSNKTTRQLKAMAWAQNFAVINNKSINVLLSKKWVGGSFSSRIWRDTKRLAKIVPRLVGSTIVTGRSTQKTTKVLKERFNVAQYQASTLIRTETAFIRTEATRQTFVDNNITEYKYSAVLDNHTSKICSSLSNKVFKTKDAEVGVNYPPMHPNCRSDVEAVINTL